MPTYEFRCPNGHDFDRFFKTMSTAAVEVACPECGAMGARQLSAGAGLLFKGSGFYLTDYGKNAHRAAPKKEGGDASTTESKPAEARSDAAAPKAEGTKPKAESTKPKAESPKPNVEKPGK